MKYYDLYIQNSVYCFERLPFITEEEVRKHFLWKIANSYGEFNIRDSKEITTDHYFSNIKYEKKEDLYSLTYIKTEATIFPIKRHTGFKKFLEEAYKESEVTIIWHDKEEQRYVAAVDFKALKEPSVVIIG